MKKTLDSSVVKLTNYRSVWGYIHKNKQATIPQIAKSIGLSLPTVTRAIDYGVAEGIIEPDGVIGAERGRKAQVYKLNADRMHILYMYIDSDVILFRKSDFRTRTIKSGEVPICDDNVLSKLDELIETSMEADPLIRIAVIAVTGIVKDGMILDSAMLPSLNGVNIVEHINEKFCISAVAENDLHAAAHVALNYSDCEDNVALFYAYGKLNSGSAIIVNGKVLCGASGAAGELENVPLSVLKADADRIEFCSEQLRVMISLINPDKVVIYELIDGLDTSKLISMTKEKLKPYLVPEFKTRESFFEDCFLGLGFILRIKIEKDMQEQLDL